MTTPFDKLKKHLVDEWRSAWKLWSVQINAVGLVLMGVLEVAKDSVNMLPPVLVSHLPHAQTIASICFALSLAARLLRQPAKKA